jgi:hypothetical protein
MTLYGYARVSTDGQTLDAQIAALKAVGADKVFSEKQSWAKADRKALAKALAALSALVVKSPAGAGPSSCVVSAGQQPPYSGPSLAGTGVCQSEETTSSRSLELLFANSPRCEVLSDYLSVKFFDSGRIGQAVRYSERSKGKAPAA